MLPDAAHVCILPRQAYFEAFLKTTMETLLALINKYDQQPSCLA
jgi:hypothetical protein